MTSFRNLIGGFLGGFLGILVSWFINPAILPLGVLFGVVVGWWNEEILRLFKEAHQQAKKTASGFIGATDHVLSAFACFCGLPATISNVFRWIIAKVIVRSIIWIASAPVRFVRWLKCHPMNRVFVIDTIVFLIFLLGTPVTGFFLEPFLGIEGEGNRGILGFLGLVIAMGGSFIYRVKHDFAKNSELKELGQFYHEWEVISHYGSIGFLFYTIAMQIRCMVGFAVFCAIALPWFFVFALVGFLGVYPLLAGLVIIQGLLTIFGRSGHWLCLGVTMLITGISWTVYHESFADPRILWTVALGTGIVSGGVTELIRRFVLTFYKHTSARRGILDLIFDANDYDKGYLGVIVYRLGGMWFRQNKLARSFRAICF